MKTEYWPQGGEWIASESLTQYAWGNTKEEAIINLKTMKQQNQHPTEYCPPLRTPVDLDNYDGPDNMMDIADDKEPMDTWEDEE